ncbi:HAMP domain-containing histidine kinase [Chitinophaga sp. Mgbs1]|uniref:histidine kinase n=1 Tax=Chitinophaga solisilvae TaxID=1233460 RepID=A0A3S1B2R1_9BACT|nr:HAMP domain-containing histidine kinase [Chitinophaga solisilvae]
MKLLTKLTLFITLSKVAIVVLFVLLLPALVDKIAYQYNDYYLKEQKKKVLQVISKNGIGAYLQGEKNYGSYTMLKEEYISLEPAGRFTLSDTIATVRRVVEEDTLTYRVLSHVFTDNQQRYVLEVGKTTSTISQYNRPLQRVALFVLITLIVITIMTDLVFTRLLLRPLGLIISTRLVNRKFPFREQLPHISTSTTDFKYLDDSLIELMGKIKSAFEKEREFTSNASHELMTPISILQNKMENIMTDAELDEEVQKQIMGMMKTLHRLKKIVHSLLFISRIENDQFPKTDQLPLRELVTTIMDELDERLLEKRLSFSLQLPTEATIRNASHDLIFQLLYNLLNNAIRYNKPGGAIMVYDQHSPGTPFRLMIRDTGIGIPDSEMATIFDRFKKVNRNGQEGYGLGLSIVNTIAQYHGITITVSAAPGEGTIFTIIFPDSMIGG